MPIALQLFSDNTYNFGLYSQYLTKSCQLFYNVCQLKQTILETKLNGSKRTLSSAVPYLQISDIAVVSLTLCSLGFYICCCTDMICLPDNIPD